MSVVLLRLFRWYTWKMPYLTEQSEPKMTYTAHRHQERRYTDKYTEQTKHSLIHTNKNKWNKQTIRSNPKIISQRKFTWRCKCRVCIFGRMAIAMSGYKWSRQRCFLLFFCLPENLVCCVVVAIFVVSSISRYFPVCVFVSVLFLLWLRIDVFPVN